MAAYDLVSNGVAFTAGVHSIVPAILNAGADSHTITLPTFFVKDPDDVDQASWIVEACGISMDAADDLTVTVTDPDASGPVFTQALLGATSTSWRLLAGEWFPQGSVVTLTTTTGIGVRIRFAARKDRQTSGMIG
jgi:hypothetical protein